jgi:FkbM family methyltransferase
MKNNIKFMHDFYKNDRFIIKYFLRYFIRKNNFNKAKDKMPNFVIINNDYVSMDILIDGYYELKELKVLFGWLKNKIKFNNVLDVGAYLGNHSVYFSNYFKGVVSFEPNPYSYDLLKINTKQKKNIKIYNFGLSNKNSTEDFYNYEFNHGGSSVIKNKKIPHTKHRAKFYSFDKLNLKKKIDLIKIDVEGNELNVLKGMKETIQKSSPIILFETQKKEIFNGTSAVINYLKSIEYNKFYSIENYPNTKVTIFNKLAFYIKFIFFSRKKYIVERDKFESKFYTFIIAEKK